MRLQHAEDIDKASRRKATTLASLARQAELDREDWARRAKDGASAGGEEVREVRGVRVKNKKQGGPSTRPFTGCRGGCRLFVHYLHTFDTGSCKTRKAGETKRYNVPTGICVTVRPTCHFFFQF